MSTLLNRLLFLDIDGVLNSYQHTLIKPHLVGEVRKPEDAINETCLGLLKYVVNETKSKIVVTSTWRKEYSQDELCSIFKNVGWDIPLIGYTCSTDKNFRGEEVARFLDMYVQDNDLEAYVIVDDSSDYYLGEGLNMDFRFNQPLVRTDPRIGFSYKEVLGVLHYLMPEHSVIADLKIELEFRNKVHVDTPWLRT